MTEYPFTAYYLTPSCQLRTVVIRRAAVGNYLVTDTGETLHSSRVHPTIKQAVAAGLAKVKATREAIRKRRKENDLRYSNLCRIEDKSREDGSWR